MVEWVKKVCEPILQKCKLRFGGEGSGDCQGNLGWGWNPSLTLVLCSLPADHGSSDRVGARADYMGHTNQLTTCLCSQNPDMF